MIEEQEVSKYADLGFKRRIKAVDISGSLFDAIVKNDLTPHRVSVKSSIPDDAKLIHVFWMPDKSIVRLVYEHSSFNEIVFLGKYLHDYSFMQSEWVEHTVHYD